jgi:transcriptional regulator with XRE-family HTH domain
MNQVDLAVRTGLTRTTISRLENGDPNAYPSTIKKLAKALKVKPHELWEE